MDKIDGVKIRLKKYFESKIDKSDVEPVKLFEEFNSYYLVLRNLKSPDKILFARSFDGFDFNQIDETVKFNDIQPDFPASAIVKNYTVSKQNLMFFGDRHIYQAYSKDKINWLSKNKNIINSPYPLEVGGAFLSPQGIMLLYFEKFSENNLIHYTAHLALFNKSRPDKLIWKTSLPVWNSRQHWPNNRITFLGSAIIKNKIVMYWYVDQKVIFGVFLTAFIFNPKYIKTQARLSKHPRNPIIRPRRENHWEAFNTLNPAAVYLDKKVHILYRAQGYDYISTFGYATSSDAININSRLDYPVYSPRAYFEVNKSGSVNPSLISAGGWGGCEDPRLTLLDGRVYLVYVAFDGWTNLRLALTSIDIDDFLNQRWNWEKPALISPPHVIDKSGCLLPEKINGKFVFFHRVFPNILIDFVDDLNFRDKKWLKGQYLIKIRPKMWDSRKIGVGAPPLRTREGWLLIYYGVDDKDASKYHIGAMLLDINNPTKVLFRSNKPVLSPSEHYENNGFKPGIAYPCGAVIIKNKLFVYYGAADSTVCVAGANLADFLDKLKSDRSPHLTDIQVKEVNF